MAVSWPLVGRAEELEFASAALDATAGLLVAGGAGVGKTRLVHEIAEELRPRFAVEWTTATPASATIPFGAFGHLIPDVDLGDDRLQLVRGTIAALLERAGGRPLALVVDDAQWLDPGANALVHRLVVRDDVRVVLTLRTGDEFSDPVMPLWKDGLIERLELQPLALADVENLISSALNGPIERATLHRFWELSRGNVLFLRELVAGGNETGALVCEEGIWHWRGDFQPSIRLATILQDRLRRVTRQGRAVLDLLAVGEPLPVDTLLLLSDPEGLAELERAGLVLVELDGSSVRLSHPLYAEALRKVMSTVQRRALAAALANAMDERKVASRGDLLRVATWQVESGSGGDPALMTEAAQIANAMFAHALAERLARAALDQGGSLGAALALADALTRQGKTHEAIAVLEPLAPFARTDREIADIALARYLAVVGDIGFRPELETMLLAAEGAIHDPDLLSFLRAQRATVLAFGGRVDDAISLASTIFEAGDEVSRLRSVPALGAAWLCAGRPDAAAALAQRMLEPALRRRNEMPQAPFWVISTQLPALVGAGRLSEADEVIALVEAASAAGGASAETPSFLAFARGLVALYRGRVQAARRWLLESIPGMRSIALWRTPFALAHLVEACALTGDVHGAARAEAEAEELVAGAAIFEGLVRRARGWVALAQGQHSRAAELACAAAVWSQQHGQHAAAARSLHDAVRFAGQRGPTKQLLAAVGHHEGVWASAVATQATGLIEGDGARLETAATQFEEMGALLLAAECAVHAATAFRRQGLVAREERSVSRAQVLASACEGARSPTLAQLSSPPALTPRELEIALLAADGLTSKAIAERLCVSTRTVEGHLRQVYAKLGVGSRHALVPLLRSLSGAPGEAAHARVTYYP